MNEYSVQHALAVHDGGTKFYAVYEVTRGAKRAVLCHWGPVSVQAKPATGGQHQLHADASATKMEREIARKTKGGYRDWRKSPVVVYDENRLMGLLGPVAMERLRDAFSDAHEDDVSFEPNEPVTYATAADESWGSW